MDLPLQITFRDVPPSAAIEARIRDQVAELEQFYHRIMSCRVVVDSPHRHQHQGRLFGVRIDLTLPGRELVTGRAPSQNHAHEDVYVAIRDAFDAARRQLEDHARRERGEIKSHAPAAEGWVARIFSEPGYGFIETPDGREIYFHRNSIVDGDFDRLEVGTAVRFAEEAGEKGPQASTVHPRRKRHAPATGG
jgi:ribosomal subunit interface protein